jgi:hypothetical protein
MNFFAKRPKTPAELVRAVRDLVAPSGRLGVDYTGGFEGRKKVRALTVALILSWRSESRGKNGRAARAAEPERREAADALSLDPPCHSVRRPTRSSHACSLSSSTSSMAMPVRLSLLRLLLQVSRRRTSARRLAARSTVPLSVGLVFKLDG